MDSLILNLEFLHRQSQHYVAHSKIPQYCAEFANRFLYEVEQWSQRMPKQSSRNGTYTQSIEFINYKLSPEEKKDFELWAKGGYEEFAVHIANFALLGYKTSFSYDKSHETYVASSTIQQDNSKNAGKCLVSRHSDWIIAVLLNVFKTHVVAQNADWSSLSLEDDWG